ncbi:N2,N2-dimethylguanosine tRNA methyltransferase [Hirsutella rhossiliensis]|uniref:N2,N2-dimethylguanosine tRNA methyltransferase n=1 Tax=Hirsutella rhossiliensis TaxID=111463 RepID=A0A9P8SFF8_9HYPO|nr:N2,N2-dimethylguanosine tRNA methyltransferase [Hirsutella rhossiliensis]KAH0958971.1 N2,N2-dimethylguanosine tRNA methyltransferase [Hirsutella rhossiliensis]
METPGRLERRDSQQTFVSLLQLDPSPMDSPREDKELPPLPPEALESTSSPVKAGATAGAPGLSGGHGAIYYLTRVQRYSSYAVSIFTSLHLANVSLIPLATRSVAGSETYLLMTREIYQTAIAEPLLVALPVVAHIGSGLALRLLRRWQNMRRYGGGTPGMGVRLWPPMSYISISGYAFALVYCAHVFVNRVLPLAVDGDSSNIGLAYVAHGFARQPGVSLAAYLGLIGAGCGHMVWGMARWLGLARSTRGWAGRKGVLVDGQTRKQRRRQWMGVHGAALALAALWAAGGLGVVARGGAAQGWIAKMYDDLLARVRM